MMFPIFQSTNETKLPHLNKKTSQVYLTHHITFFENGNISNEEIIELEELFFSQYNILNSLIIYCANGELNIFTYFPFKKQLHQLKENSYNRQSLFPDKTKNLHKYPLRFSLYLEEHRQSNKKHKFRFEPDILVVKELAKQINATIVIIPPVDDAQGGAPLPSKSHLGALGQLVRRDSDMATNRRLMAIQFTQYKLAETTIAVGRNDFCVVVPYSILPDELIHQPGFMFNDPLFFVCNIIMVIGLSMFYHYILRFYDNKMNPTISKYKSNSTPIWYRLVQWELNGTYKLANGARIAGSLPFHMGSFPRA